MKSKKMFGFAICALAALVLAACGGTDPTTQVRILVPSADHGWTGAVMNTAQSYAQELNAEGGDYTYVVNTTDDAETQNNQISDIIASGAAGVVILPYNNDVESGVTSLANSEIPFVMFDRIIENTTILGAENYVAGVKGDNEGIGEETAKYMLDNGLREDTTGKILVMPGDNSSVPESRNLGFTNVLKEAGWSDADLATDSTGRLVFTNYTDWSRDTSYQLFITWINGTSDDLDGVRYIFTHDSEIALGVIEALASGSVPDAKVQAFKENIKILASSSGLEEMYQVIRGDHPRSSTYNTLLEGILLMDVTYDPEMIVDAIDDMVAYLNGETVTQDHVIAVDVIDATNVDSVEGFGGKVS